MCIFNHSVLSLLQVSAGHFTEYAAKKNLFDAVYPIILEESTKENSKDARSIHPRGIAGEFVQLAKVFQESSRLAVDLPPDLKLANVRSAGKKAIERELCVEPTVGYRLSAEHLCDLACFCPFGLASLILLESALYSIERFKLS